MAAMCTAVYHGPDGLREIATRIHLLTSALFAMLRDSRVRPTRQQFFDTLVVEVPDGVAAVRQRAIERGINLRYVDERTISISLNEAATFTDVEAIAEVVSGQARAGGFDVGASDQPAPAVAGSHDAAPAASGLHLDTIPKRR